jgi:hypothetical protein
LAETAETIAVILSDLERPRQTCHAC